MKRLALAIALGVFVVATPALATPGPPEAPQYWFDGWQIPQLWQGGARGQGVVIAELDTGVNADVSGVKGKVLAGTDFGVSGGDGRVDRDTDEFGHGTALASIMVSDPSTFDITGIAPKAKILPVALPLVGTTDATDADHVAEAIRWSADHGANIISMAIGARRSPAADPNICPTAMQSAIDYALSKNVVLLAAAGNDADGGSSIEAPAVCLGVVAVGAVDQSNSVARFSSRHRYVSLAAPGVNIPSLGRVDGTAYTGNGTSQATAIASAVAALAWSKHPSETGRQVVARLLATLDSKTAEPSREYGYGLLNAHAAVVASVPKDASNPVYARLDPFLKRDTALEAASGEAPAPSAKADLALGAVHIDHHSTGFFTAKAITGLVIAFAGLCGLAVLLVVFRRERRGSAH